MIFTEQHLIDGITVKKWQSNGYFPVSKYKIDGEDVVLLVQSGDEFVRINIWSGMPDCSQVEYHLFVLNNNNYKIATNECPENFD